MIALVAVAWLFFSPATASPPTCPDWKALAKEGEDNGFLETPSAEVAAAFRRAAEAAQCSNEPTEVIDRLWLRNGDWLSREHPAEALAFIQERLQRIRAEEGKGNPRETPYLWMEAGILAHEKRDLGRAEKAVQEALKISVEAFGDPSPGVAASHRRVAWFYRNTSRMDLALASIDQAIQTAEQSGQAGRQELYQALDAKYFILDFLKTLPAELERVVRRMAALRKELEAEGWTPPDEPY